VQKNISEKNQYHIKLTVKVAFIYLKRSFIILKVFESIRKHFISFVNCC